MSRWTGGIALLLLLSVMARWSWLNLEGVVGWRDLVVHPEQRDGENVVLSLVTVGPVLAADRFVVYYGSLPLEVVGDPTQVRKGQDVTIGGRFSAADSAVIAAWVEHRPARSGKKWLGVFGLLVLGGVLAASWRVGPEGVMTRG